MDNSSNTSKRFTLIDKFTIGSIALIGIFFTVSLTTDSIIIDGLLNRMLSDGVLVTVNDNKSFLLELIVYSILAIGAISLLWSESKTAWLFTCTPLFIITIYFSYSVIVTLLRTSTEASGPIEFLGLGFLISLNFILLLFCLTLVSKSFQDKLKS